MYHLPRCLNLTFAIEFFLLSRKLFLSATPCASPPSCAPIFYNYYFLVHHPVNPDDQRLLAHAMASDFTAAWQFSQREQLVFRYI
jgi:hypothetical protein